MDHRVLSSDELYIGLEYMAKNETYSNVTYINRIVTLFADLSLNSEAAKLCKALS